MQVYFSHSYRDKGLNSHFQAYFRPEGVVLQADQKSTIWCVAKLERYMFETSGFVGVIPRRSSDTDSVSYSEYIGQELNLARRARVPRLLFVDQSILDRHTVQFPEDTIPFNESNLEEHRERHASAIAAFRGSIQGPGSPLKFVRVPNRATLVVDDSALLRSVSSDVGALLRRENFDVTQELPSRRTRSLDNLRLLETLWRSELCVFLLGNRLSEAHLAAALAHAHAIPSIRLQFDPKATECTPTLTGIIRWKDREALLVEFRRQLASFRRGFVEPVDMASVGTTVWEPQKDNLWQIGDARALLQHVRPSDGWIQDQAIRAHLELRKDGTAPARDRTGSLQACRALYDGFSRLHFMYETEPRTGLPSGIQKIRSPALIQLSRGATCIDLACFFAALLEASGQFPVIIILDDATSSHALIGYRAPDEGPMTTPSLGDLRQAIQLGDVVLFEATGAVQTDGPVGAESAEDRKEK